MILTEGEYIIPDDCRVIATKGKVEVFKRLTHRLKAGEYRCKDCKYFSKGPTTFRQSSDFWGYVCKQKPKKLKYCADVRYRMYYTAQKYGRICKNFALKESVKNAEKGGDI